MTGENIPNSNETDYKRKETGIVPSWLVQLALLSSLALASKYLVACQESNPTNSPSEYTSKIDSNQQFTDQVDQIAKGLPLTKNTVDNKYGLNKSDSRISPDDRQLLAKWYELAQSVAPDSSYHGVSQIVYNDAFGLTTHGLTPAFLLCPKSFSLVTSSLKTEHSTTTNGRTYTISDHPELQKAVKEMYYKPEKMSIELTLDDGTEMRLVRITVGELGYQLSNSDSDPKKDARVIAQLLPQVRSHKPDARLPSKNTD